MALFKKVSDGNFREIRPDDPEKKGVKLYFELIKRKFWNYIKLNLLYFVLSLPTLALYSVVIAMFVMPNFLGILAPSETATDFSATMADGQLILFFSCLGAVLLVTFFGGGLFSAGYNYILRNYVRQENAYIVSDLFGQTKKNFGQALFVSVIDFIVVSVGMFSISYYFKEMVITRSPLFIFAFALLVFAFLLYVAMHTYMWTLMVTFKVSLKQIYKNSFMLTVGTASRSVVYMLAVALFIIVSTALLLYFQVIVFALFAIMFMALFNLAGQVFSYPVIKKYMIDNNNDDNSKGNDE